MKLARPMLVAGGNPVFAGKFDDSFDALDTTTNRKLWHYQTGAEVNASQVTYMVNRKQHVAVVAGDNAANGNNILMKKARLGFGDPLVIFAAGRPTAAMN